MLKEKIIVYTSGTFDMFHSNHVKMINYARGLGDILIIGVSTDELACSYKSPPTIPFEERISIIGSLKQPDIVVPQHSLDQTQMVKNLHVDAFVVGDDWIGKFDYLGEFGVKVFYFPYGAGASSTKIKEQIGTSYLKILKKIDNHSNPNIIKNKK
jgi:glycerol-3-phosphate cytidylyltransferase